MSQVSEEQRRAAIVCLDQAQYHHDQWHKNLIGAVITHAAIARVDEAQYQGNQWYRNLFRSLVAQLPPDTREMMPDAHKRCPFGRWYESLAAECLREQAAFAALGEAHRQVHESAAGLLRQGVEGLAITVNDLNQLTNLLDRMRLENLSLRDELVATSQSHDPLTGARNGTGLPAELREQQTLVRRGLQECTLVRMDLDRLGGVSKGRGQVAGEAVLAGAVKCLDEEVRPGDHIYRVGGDELLVLMPRTGVDAAAGVAERFRAAIAARPVDDRRGEPQVTASFGVVALDGTHPVEESIDRADEALDEAKVAGRKPVATAT